MNTETNIIDAPHGTSRKYERTNPTEQFKKLIAADKSTIPLKLQEKTFAVTCGTDSRAITITIPTTLRQATTVKATNAVITASIIPALIRCDNAKS